MKNLLFISLSFFALTLSAQQLPTVYSTGAMKDMGNSYHLKMWLDTISNKSHLYGLGPYDKMKGEITIVDGTPYLASAFVDGEYEIKQSWNARSPFFVYSNVSKWEPFAIEASFTTVDEIQNTITTIAKENGYDLSEPFAIKIKGDFDEITAHIVTPRSPEVEGYRPNIKSQKFSFDKSKGEIIGFYSLKHQGIFTHSDSYVHLHFITDDTSFMGHLDAIQTKKRKYTVYLPKRE